MLKVVEEIDEKAINRAGKEKMSQVKDETTMNTMMMNGIGTMKHSR